LVSATNHGAYENWRHSSSFDPQRVYFYFVTKPHQLPEPDVRLYIYDHNVPIRGEYALKPIVTKLARAAASDIPPAPCITQFDEIAWTRMSYIVFFLFDARAQVRRRAAIVFDPRKGGTENHSFFNAKEMDIDISGDTEAPRTIVATYLKDYMAADEFGNLLA